MAIIVVFALLALFSIISIVMSAEEPRSSNDYRDDSLRWAAFGRR